ncbi:hypothetical protein BMA10247_A2147 [Burkholderia mallei NCTC 10247]|nr:hypothetical protein BMA10247_A2147 [Burkholderia mallei NCTC 10247]EEP87109.1 conserved hypothetical protein [Burkholderia mallei GB8 horse 4]
MCGVHGEDDSPRPALRRGTRRARGRESMGPSSRKPKRIR